MKNFVKENWFKITIIFLISIFLLTGLVILFINQSSHKEFLKKQIELQEKEVELREFHLMREEKKRSEEQRLAEEEKKRIEQEELERQRSEKITNECIKKAKIERDRRTSNIQQVWITGLSEGMGSSQWNAERNIAIEGVNNMYIFWEANCKMGISNNF